MSFNVYLSGEIHTDWREEMIVPRDVVGIGSASGQSQ